ncbi:hypothetical protein ColTof4_01227 [Colletotrichum tofieldiae]|nr:hypothetical protein ColTof4_01227 [Colletotrichum tofieldiae]
MNMETSTLDPNDDSAVEIDSSDEEFTVALDEESEVSLSKRKGSLKIHLTYEKYESLPDDINDVEYIHGRPYCARARDQYFCPTDTVIPSYALNESS